MTMPIYYTGSLTPTSSGGGGEITIDQTYEPTSANAQSGVAIAGAGFLTSSDLTNYVPNTRTVNNKALSSDITLLANDVSAVANTNYIADGTVIEGKFSDLPAFFAGLEGKWCNGTVTYKITEDEEISTKLEIDTPDNAINQIVIDGNEKTITSTYDVNWGAFCKITNSKKNNVIVIKSLNVTTNESNQSSSLTRCGIQLTTVNNIFVEECSFSGFWGNGLVFINCYNAIIQSCEFSANSVHATLNDAISSQGSMLFIRSCLFTKQYSICIARRAAIVSAKDNTITDCTYNLNIGDGSIGCTYDTTKKGNLTTTRQGFATGLAYNT